MKLLTNKNVKPGLWIKDPDYGLAQVIHVHKSVSAYMNETPITYKIYGGHYCYTSTDETGERYKIYIVPRWRRYLIVLNAKLKKLF